MAEVLRPRFAVHLTMDAKDSSCHKNDWPGYQQYPGSETLRMLRIPGNKVGQTKSISTTPTSSPQPLPPCLEVSVSLSSFGQPGIDQTDLKFRGLSASAFHAGINTMWKPTTPPL